MDSKKTGLSGNLPVTSLPSSSSSPLSLIYWWQECQEIANLHFWPCRLAVVHAQVMTQEIMRREPQDKRLQSAAIPVSSFLPYVRLINEGHWLCHSGNKPSGSLFYSIWKWLPSKKHVATLLRSTNYDACPQWFERSGNSQANQRPPNSLHYTTQSWAPSRMQFFPILSLWLASTHCFRWLYW